MNRKCTMFVGFCIVMMGFLLLYMNLHMEKEKACGDSLPLPWEKGGWMNRAKRKIFDKSDIIYRDGDNT